MVSLRYHVETRFRDMEEKTELARMAMEKRLDGMNEFRDALRDQAGRFIPRTEYVTLLKDVQELKESRAELRGKASQNSVIVAYVIARHQHHHQRRRAAHSLGGTMSSMFLWGGLTCIVALAALGVPYMVIVGAILMVVGLVLLILGK